MDRKEWFIESMTAFNISDLVFVNDKETVYRVDKIDPRVMDEDYIRYHSYNSEDHVGDPLTPMLHLTPIYDAKQRRIKLRRKSRDRVIDARCCHHVTENAIQERIDDLQRRLVGWINLKKEVGVKK